MFDSAEYRELREAKGYYTSIERAMSNHGIMEENITGISMENVEK